MKPQKFYQTVLYLSLGTKSTTKVKIIEKGKIRRTMVNSYNKEKRK